jgi:hypothetical protein
MHNQKAIKKFFNNKFETDFSLLYSRQIVFNNFFKLGLLIFLK